MKKVTVLAIALFVSSVVFSQKIEFVTAKNSVYENGQISYIDTAQVRHIIDLDKKTITLFCDDCQVSGKPEPITDILNFEKNGLSRITFTKSRYDFYIYARKKDGVYTVKKMIVYEDRVIKYDYFMN